jgi:hypothetical protein
MNFADMTTEQFAGYIKTKWTAPLIKAAHLGPKLAIRGIESTVLPEKLTRLVNQIMASERVFDIPSDEAVTTLAPHTPGKMRSYHGNIDRWLPPADASKATSKSRRYADYIAEFKGQPNNLKGKAGGDTGQTGYIEYTAAGWTQAVQHGRLVFNYYEDVMYLTPHYQTGWFGEGESPFVLVQWRMGLGLLDDTGKAATKQAVPWALSAADV